MPVKKFRPVTPSLRFKTVSSFEEITKNTPEKSLVEPNKKSGGTQIIEGVSRVVVAVVDIGASIAELISSAIK